jgi:hypothetical protein
MHNYIMGCNIRINNEDNVSNTTRYHNVHGLKSEFANAKYVINT